MKKKLLALALVFLIAFTFVVVYSGNKEEAQPSDNKKVKPVEEKIDVTPGDKIYARYMYGTKRCATCKKLEAFAKEAIETGFVAQLKDSILVWQPINYDEKENKHYIDDYKLYTKALILSRVRDGKEIDWVNLENIWKLVNNKDKYIEYVQVATRKFMTDKVKDE